MIEVLSYIAAAVFVAALVLEAIMLLLTGGAEDRTGSGRAPSPKDATF